MKRRTVFILALVATVLAAGAQERLTLQQCLKMGLERNLALRVKEGEVRKAPHNLSENRAKLLPQLNGVVSANDNFDPPVSVTDGSAYGTLYNVTKTLQYNASAGLQLQMPLYNKQLYTAMDITRLLNSIDRMSYEKAREDLIMQISQMYYLAQNTVEQLGLVRDNIRRLKALRDITVAFYDNSMALEVDVQRVNINLENLQVQYDNAQAMLTQQYNMLKYVLDYPAEQEICVELPQTDKVVEPSLPGLSTNLYELQLLQARETLAKKQLSMTREGYLPTLSLSGSWMFSSYTDKLSHWFHSGPSNHWYRSNGLGLSLRVPIFDGWDKRSKIRKNKIDIETAQTQYANTLKNLQTQYVNATCDMENNRRNYKKQKDNCTLAENVCRVTTDRYKEGIASMTDVLQDEMRITEAQNNYITAHYNYQVANLTLLKLTGQLDKLM